MCLTVLAVSNAEWGLYKVCNKIIFFALFRASRHETIRSFFTFDKLQPSWINIFKSVLSFSVQALSEKDMSKNVTKNRTKKSKFRINTIYSLLNHFLYYVYALTCQYLIKTKIFRNVSSGSKKGPAGTWAWLYRLRMRSKLSFNFSASLRNL